MNKIMDCEARYDDGQWYAVTLGHFIGLLVDAGHDPAVIFRVTHDGPSDENNAFVRELEVVMVPDGHIEAEMKRVGCSRIQKILRALMEAGVVAGQPEECDAPQA